MFSFLSKRFGNSWRLSTSIFVGIFIATSLGSTIPLYIASLDQLAFNVHVDRLSVPFINFHVIASEVPLTRDTLKTHEESINIGINRHISDIYDGRDLYFRGDDLFVWTKPVGNRGTDGPVSHGYFQYLSNLENHSIFSQGRMGVGTLGNGEHGPVVEAVLSSKTAEKFNLAVGDYVSIAPTPTTIRVISAMIVGIFEPDNSSDLIWDELSVILDPPPPVDGYPKGFGVKQDQPPIPMFLATDAMFDVVDRAYPGIIVKINPVWLVRINTKKIKGWSLDEVRLRLDGFEGDIVRTISDSSVTTVLFKGVVGEIKRKSFFTRVPLLMLSTLIFVLVIFQISMVFYYLVQHRRIERSLIKIRGGNIFQLIWLDIVEVQPVIISTLVFAPLFAIGGVSLLGKMPHFSEITGGNLLPLDINYAPFLFGVLAGLLCLCSFVVMGFLATRGTIIEDKIRASRRPSLGFFHRYYLDVALMIVGGLIFAEFQSRGQLVSGGIFKDVNVNEASLFVPILFLAMVALIFVRVFPLLMRFVSGESRLIVHILATASVITFIAIVLLIDRNNSSFYVATLAVGVIFVYWITSVSKRGLTWVVGLVIQTGLVVTLIVIRQPEFGELVLIPTAGLLGILIAQLLFRFLKLFITVAPVWFSLGLLYLSRDPMRYVWLVLFLVLAIGLGILSTTVGGTLERSQIERISYKTPSDLIARPGASLNEIDLFTLRDELTNRADIESVSLGWRSVGTMGSKNIQVLAVDSTKYGDGSWYRDDFSVSSLSEIMESIQPRIGLEPLEFPDNSTSVGIWIRPIEFHPHVSVWIVIKDAAGTMKSLMLGQMGETKWHRLSADIPDDLVTPLQLVSVQLYEPSSFVGAFSYAGPSGRGGTVLLDNLHTMVDGKVRLVEDFESAANWRPILTSLGASDQLEIVDGETYQGQHVGRFTFGRYRNMSVRGIYHNSIDTPVSVVLGGVEDGDSYAVGDLLKANISGRFIPVVVRDVVTYFPSVEPEIGTFLVSDLSQILNYLNMMGQISTIKPSELYVQIYQPDQDISPIVEELSGFGLRVEDRVSQLELLRLDPLVTAGWRTMVLIGLVVVSFATISGFLSYVFYYASSERWAISSLRAIGLSKFQLLGLLGLEHLVIGMAGIGIGTWAGLRVSRLMVESLAVTEMGEKVFPPFVLTTNWALLVPVYVAIGGVLLGSVFLLGAKAARWKLSDIGKVT